MRYTVGEAAACLTGSQLHGPEGTRGIGAVRTDSRTLEPGDLFVCLVGERHDGHDFAAQAARLGAAAVVVSRTPSGLSGDLGCPLIQVPDTLAGLGRLGRCWRDRFARTGGKVVAVTGTAGKTTVKELIAQALENILAAKHGKKTQRVAKNHKNFNNQVGLPLSILAATGTEDAWVMEVGISKPHDMDELGVVVAPDVALVLNVGPAHLEGLGSLAGVAQAKASLLRHVDESGTALCSMDYPELWTTARAQRPDVVGFSARDESARYFARFVEALEDGRGRFELSVAGERVQAILPACGSHFAENAAAVAAVCHTLGHSAADIAAGLDGCVLPEQRFCCSMRGGWCVVDDTYNANPLSMARSIEAARLMAGDKPLVLVLGEMRELGTGAAQAHEELGALLPTVAPEAVFFKGDHADDVARGAGKGLAVRRVQDPAEVLAQLPALNAGHGVVLVKGSRSLRMELFAQAILCELGADSVQEGGAA